MYAYCQHGERQVAEKQWRVLPRIRCRKAQLKLLIYESLFTLKDRPTPDSKQCAIPWFELLSPSYIQITGKGPKDVTAESNNLIPTE